MTPTTEFTEFELVMDYHVAGGALPVARLAVDSRHVQHGSVTTGAVMGTIGSVLKLKVIEDKAKAESAGLSSEVKHDAGTEKRSEISFHAVHRATQGGYRPIFRLETPAETKLFIRNIKLRPLDLKPIFNGKDLTGWKEFPGRKSKFTVTEKAS